MEANRMTSPPVGASSRVVAIDGLRGVAATLVVLFHLHGAVSRSASNWLWGPLDWVARNGALGVDIFFVISGFVIALSVSKGAPTLAYFGRFILRRSIRLDPPYWSAILLEVLLLRLTVWFVPDHPVTLPSTPQLLAHFAYLQELLGYGSIVNIFWTLCYEIQFYGFFVGIVVLQPMLPARLRGPRVIAFFCAPLFVISIWTRYWPPAGLLHGLAINRWFQFFLGVLTYDAVAGTGRLRTLILAWGVLVAAVVAAHQPATQLLAVLVSAWLVATARDARWGWVFTTRPVMLLGAMSYSIYLYHSSVGWRFVTVMQRVIPGQWGTPTAIGVCVLGIIVSIGFAAVLWYFIERPCLKLSHRIALPRRADQNASVPVR
jgi:peptidoglycan/LPS O-acetylase OafA/YrhL